MGTPGQGQEGTPAPLPHTVGAPTMLDLPGGEIPLFHEHFLHRHSPCHPHEEGDREEDPLLPFCRVLGGSSSSDILTGQTLKRNCHWRGSFLLQAFISLSHPSAPPASCRMRQGGWQRHHAEPNQQPHGFNLLLHERLV